MPGLLKEIWIAQFLEKYRQSLAWMSGIELDMTAFVDNNKINLQEAGVDPGVLVNNTVYPIPVEDIDDLPVSIELDTFDTKTTVIRNAESVQYSYDKLEVILRRHRQSLEQAEALKASHAFAPVSNTELTPVIATTGGDNGSGFRFITEDDVFRLAERYDDIDAPQENRHLVLHSRMWNELVRTSPTLKEQRYRMQPGVVGRNFLELAEFKIWKYRGAAVYNKTTGTKKAYGAAAAPATDTISSFAYVGSEACMAMGTLEMFDSLRDVDARGDKIGFQQRFIALPVRNKYFGAIYAAEFS